MSKHALNTPSQTDLWRLQDLLAEFALADRILFDAAVGAEPQVQMTILHALMHVEKRYAQEIWETVNHVTPFRTVTDWKDCERVSREQI